MGLTPPSDEVEALLPSERHILIGRLRTTE
jgi:hypothetical protein